MFLADLPNLIDMPRSIGAAPMPAIRTILLVAGLVMLMPLLVVARADLSHAEERVNSAQTAAASAARLDVLVRLAPALSIERNATGAALGTREMPVTVPQFALDAMGLDFEGTMVEARLAVDVLLERLPNEEFVDAVRAVRDDVDASSSTIGAVDQEYEVALGMVARLATNEIAQMAVISEDSNLLDAVRVAEAAAEVQIRQAGLVSSWASLVAPFSQPTVDRVRALSDDLALYRSASSKLSLVADDDSAVAAPWRALLSLDDHEQLLAALEATAVEKTAGGSSTEALGLDEQFDFTSIDPDTLDVDGLMGSVVEIGSVMDMSAVVGVGLSDVVDAALVEVDDQAVAIEADAANARTRVIAALAVFTLLFTVGGLLLVRLIARPAHRMATAAHALRDGLLDERIDESGPRELRVAASAMNEAIASLKLAESQAVALAEERLDDPVLSRPAAGTLGLSLQASVARLTASLTEREEFQRRLAHEASHDGLTNLPNRNAILANVGAALARTRRASTLVAILFLDLDSFKAINDVHGHQAGDLVLRTTAKRLVSVIREGDLAGRLGGDEFVVLAEPVADIDEVVRLAERVLAVLAEPIEVTGVSITPSVSVGIALSDGADLTADELLRDADLAVYRAKERGRGRIEVCDEDLREQVVERTNLEHAIGEAIAAGEFVLHFQPTVDSRTSTINSLEALVRWQRPDGELLPPGAFIPVAERSDLIIEIDRWVLSAAAAQIAAWTTNPRLNVLPVAVNISGRHLSGGSLVDDVIDVLEVHGIEPASLVLEITETALLNDLTSASRDLARLRSLGVKVALDDFGTGYMSLATLRNLPVDVLKIDRSFVERMETLTDHTLVELIVQTGHLLGVAITAEGVETDEQMELLAEIGSDNLQGFLFSRPIAAHDLEELLAESNAASLHPSAT